MVDCLYAYERFILVLLSELWSNKENKPKITLELAHKQFVTKVHTLVYFLTQHDESINDDKNIDPVFHTLGLRSADDLAIDCRRRHTYISPLKHCDTRTGKTISNSLHIDFSTAIFTAGRVRNRDNG